MKGDDKVIEYLNIALTNELTAINQYFLHSRILMDWGMTKLGKKAYEESIEEMQHADVLIKRILFLEGLPQMQELNKLRIGEDVKEIIECDLQLEHKAIPDLRDAVDYCEKVRDYVTRDIFKKILDDEESHVDWLETQLNLISKMGVENYIQSVSDPIAE
ncbi:MAG: bacterioferritin [Myxococcales bacterium]|nr:bacterioferritin [Myxococcales bacterium]MCB9643655.1 bacterioferritin [Myxococcales bacterium]